MLRHRRRLGFCGLAAVTAASVVGSLALAVAIAAPASADTPPLNNGTVWTGTVNVVETRVAISADGSSQNDEYGYTITLNGQDGSPSVSHGVLTHATMAFTAHHPGLPCSTDDSWTATTFTATGNPAQPDDFLVNVIEVSGPYTQTNPDGTQTVFSNGGLNVSEQGITGHGQGTHTDSCTGTSASAPTVNSNTHDGFQDPSADGTHFNGSRSVDYTTGDSSGSLRTQWTISWNLTKEPDADFDNIADSADNCPSTFNPDQIDSDRDGKGNACDSDNDNDGVPDATDNCPNTANPDQADLDGDHVGDVCDTDIDGDGTSNAIDPCPTDPTDACVPPDTDRDGVPDKNDNCATVKNADQANFDHDSLGDACDSDIDGDGVTNAVDKCAFTPLGTAVNADGCPRKKQQFDLQVAGLYGGTIDGGEAAVIGGDSALVFADPNLLPQIGRVCILSDFKVTVRVDTPTSIPILWNGQPRPFTDDPSMYNWIILGHGKLNGKGFFTNTYWELVRIELCASSTQVHQQLTINISSVAGPVLSIEHTATAQVFAPNGTLLGDVKDDASGKSAAFKLLLDKTRTIKLP